MTPHGKTCFTPSGKLLSQESDQVTWNYATGELRRHADDHGQRTRERARVRADPHGVRPEGPRARCQKIVTATAPYEARDCTAPRAGFDIGNAPTRYEQYEFSFTGTGDDGGGKVESYNEFKKNPGIGGLASWRQRG